MNKPVKSTAGTYRRFVLPDWARHEMAHLESLLAESSMREAQLRADGRALLLARNEAERALKIITLCKRIDVVIPAPTERSTTFYILGHNTAQPVFGVSPGDTILLARGTQS